MRRKALKAGSGDWVADRYRLPVSRHCWVKEIFISGRICFFSKTTELRAKIEIFETRFSLLRKLQVFRSRPLGLENEDSYLPSILFFFLGRMLSSTLSRAGRKAVFFPSYNLKEVCISKDLEDKESISS